MKMNPKALGIYNKLRTNFPFFAKHCLFIKTKNDGVQPFILNSAQLRFVKVIEKLKSEGKPVRLVVLKARQMGFSTVTEAYFFWDTFWKKGRNSFIMAHDDKSTRNIFDMVKRFYDNIPKGMFKPSLAKNNEKALIFQETDSYFRIGTAGAGAVGRSMTNNNLHLSEAAFFKNGDDLSGGIMSTVPDKDSITVVESTANGVGGFYYDKVMQGLDPESNWTTVFFAWHEFPEYSTTAKDNFEPTEEERELIDLYNVTYDQLQWRRNRIEIDFKGREHIFKQEYPANIQEAFLSTQNALIGGDYLEKARKSQIRDMSAPVIIGVDPARSGDRTVICIRRGREILELIIFDEMNEVELAGHCANYIQRYDADACFIDVGCGYGTIDILQRRHFGDKVFGIPFNSKPINRNVYSNKRTEIYGLMRDWFMQDGGVRIPDNDVVIRDIGIIPDFKPNANGQWVMESKDSIKKMNGGASPDIADALALTFADINVSIKPSTGGSKIRVVNNRRK